MVSVALDESFNNRPDHKTQHEEWVKWYHRHKLLHWSETHKTVVTWGSELVVSLEFSGSWIEAKYIPYEGMEFDFKKKSDVVVSADKVERIIAELDKIFNLLFWDVGWYSPFIIEIDDQGRCHLLACTGVDEKVKSLDMLLRTGTKQTVTVDKDDDNDNV